MALEKFRPLGDRVLIKRLEEEDKSAGGIIIPDAAKEKGQRGEVIAIGEGRRDSATGKVTPVGVEVGKIVYFSKYAGTEIKGDLLVLLESELLGVEEK